MLMLKWMSGVTKIYKIMLLVLLPANSPAELPEPTPASTSALAFEYNETRKNYLLH